MDVQAAAVGFEDLALIFSQGVHLRLFAVTQAFRASRDKALRSRTRPRIRPHAECGVLRQVGIAPVYRVGEPEEDIRQRL